MSSATPPGRRAPRADWKPMAWFLGRCLVFWGAALWAVSRLPLIEDFGIAATVGTLHAILRLFGTGVERMDSALYVGRTSVEIVADCSPHMPYLIFAGVVLAFPAPWRKRLFGLVAGALVIHSFNVIRILALIGILVWRRSWFEFAHVYLWQTGTILVVFATFALWLRSLSKQPRTT
jgi:exosortase/archaeosortase family protein